MAVRGFQSRRRDVPASRMRDRTITIQQLTDSTGGSGVPIETWSDLVTMPASRLDISAQERFRSGHESSSVDTTWEINYLAAMDPELVDVPKKRRIVASGRAYDIVAARQTERRKLIEIVTLAGTAVTS